MSGVVRFTRQDVFSPRRVEVVRASDYDALAAERDALAKDARRYRWLRDNDPRGTAATAWRVPAATAFADPDAAIDAAIAAKGE